MLALVKARCGMEGDPAIKFVARLLDLWCDPSCQICTGRGAIGDYGKPQLICHSCGGSTRRALLWNADQQQIADAIAAEMDAKVEGALRRIQRLLRQD